jgi:hypothetical protein
MKKFLMLALFLLAPASLAQATCTWTTNADNVTGNVVCTTVTETPFTDATSAALGWQLNQCPRGIDIFACAAASNTVTGAVTLSVYAWDATAKLWGVYPDQTLVSTTGQRCQHFDGKWIVVPSGRIAVLPTAGTVSGGSFTIYFACN